MARIKTIWIMVFGTTIIFGVAILLFEHGSLQLNYQKMLYRENVLHKMSSSSKPCKSKERLTIPDNTSINATAGHLRLPVDETLFKFSVSQFGLVEPWMTRLKTLQDVCRSHRQIRENSHSSGKRYLISYKNNFVFCKVPKTGCTFLTSLYAILELGERPESAFGRNRDNVHIRTMKYLSEDISNETDRFTKIVVARDPYARLFSGYIDKIYLSGFPAAAERVAYVSGKKLFTVQDLHCGYATSFQDFLEYFLSIAVKTGNANNHWKPVYSMCQVCNIDYQLVLKTETLSKDAEFTTDHLPIEYQIKQAVKSSLRTGQATDTMIRGLILTYLRYQKSAVKNCPDSIVYLFKLWNAFKMLGYIRNTIPFPWKMFHSLEKLDTASVSEMIIDTMKRNPLSQSEKVKQKNEAIVRAYRSVRQSTIDKIKVYFKYDFLLFGYNENPPGQN